MAGSSPLLAPGVVIADTYEIERPLGRGGMGEVWAARHRRVAGKYVAVKVLHVQVDATAESLARFRREAEIAARLEHPGIVQVLDYNTLPTGEPYLVMELLKGESLAERLRGGPLPVDQVRHIVRQVGSALSVAHANGVVHRDLKPENIFLVPTGMEDQVKVLDFGISKLADSSTVQTTDSVLIGTPLYMSPEQALGNNRDVSDRSDVFSLGSICYELLTGRAPFMADSIATVVFKIAYEPHAPLLAARPDIPPEVAAAVDAALAKEPASRPDIGQLVFALTGTRLGPLTAEKGVYREGTRVTESLLSGKTMARVTPQPPPPVEKQAPVAKRGASGTVVAVGLVALVAVLWTAVYSIRKFWAETPVVASLDGGLAGGAQQRGVDGGAAGIDGPEMGSSGSGAVAAVGGAPGGSTRPGATAGTTGPGATAGTAGPGNSPGSAGPGATPGSAGPGDRPGSATSGPSGPVGMAATGAGTTDSGATAPRPPADGPKGAADSGRTPGPRRDPDPPPSSEEQVVLDRLAAIHERRDYERVENQRAVVHQLKSRAARREALLLIIDALCHRRSNQYLSVYVSELRRAASPAVFRKSRDACLEQYPEAASQW